MFMNDNILFLDNTIKMIAQKFNFHKINFYIVGALGAYIDAKIPLQRNHDDLDVMIEEKDIEKVKELFKNSEYVFFDNRYTNNKYLNEHGYPEGNHEVYANHKFSDFHIGFFLYRKNNEKYTIIEYFKENGKCKRLERSLPIEIFKYQYNDVADYKGIKVKVARKELIYKNKQVMNREKDIFDIKKLKPTIDYKMLENLKGLSKIREVVILDV